MEPSPYLIRLSRIARWRLPPKEAADVISDYSEIMAIDPRLYEDQCKDYGTPKQGQKQRLPRQFKLEMRELEQQPCGGRRQAGGQH